MAGEHVIVWRFLVDAGSTTAFERAYGPAGPWARLFGRHPGYRGSELVRGDEPGAYLTIDHWDAAASFEAFMGEWHDDYARLDAELAPLTASEAIVARGSVVEPGA